MNQYRLTANIGIKQKILIIYLSEIMRLCNLIYIYTIIAIKLHSIITPNSKALPPSPILQIIAAVKHTKAT